MKNNREKAFLCNVSGHLQMACIFGPHSKTVHSVLRFILCIQLTYLQCLYSQVFSYLAVHPKAVQSTNIFMCTLILLGIYENSLLLHFSYKLCITGCTLESFPFKAGLPSLILHLDAILFCDDHEADLPATCLLYPLNTFLMLLQEKPRFQICCSFFCIAFQTF